MPKNTLKTLNIVREESEHMFDTGSNNLSCMLDEEVKDLDMPICDSTKLKSKGDLLEVPLQKFRIPSIKSAKSIIKSAALVEIPGLVTNAEEAKGSFNI